jgi:hypothetical protein
LDKSLTKQWTLESLRVLAQSVLAKLVVRLRLLRKRRRRGGFGDCHAWTRMLALLLLFVMKYQQRSFLRLIPMLVYMLKLIPMGVTAPKLNPMGVSVLKLIPMGVTVLKLIPMGVTMLKLIPMGVTVLKLIPMGATVLKLIPMGVTVHQLLSIFLMRMKKRKKKSR